jgi:hypothetical protein
MADARLCMDCQHVRPVDAFYKTLGGTGRSSRCRDCVERRVVAHKADKERNQRELDAEFIALLSSNPRAVIPAHLMDTYERSLRGPTSKRRPRKLSNRPHMSRCAGCGETVPKRDLWEWRQGGRARYCKPCMIRRNVERECLDCLETKLTSEFSEGLEHVSPYCLACRAKREREKHCPRCDTTKPVSDFTRSAGRMTGWCKQCSVEAQRERRAAARLGSA